MATSVNIDGGLTRDPEFKYTEAGHPMWRGTIVSSDVEYIPEDRREGISKTYVSCIAFGAAAEMFAELNLTKGCEVVATGILRQYELEGADGKKERKTQVLVRTMHVTRRPAVAAATHDLPPGW